MSDTVIRVSALATYPDCNRRGATRLFWREITAAGFRLRRLSNGIGAAIGTSVHRAAKVILDEKAATGKLPPPDVATDAATQELRELLRNGVEFDGPNGPTRNLRDAVSATTSLSNAFRYIIAPTINPIVVEQRFEAKWSENIILSGQPDMIAREPKTIHDLKTGVRKSGNNLAQVGGYSLLARSNGLEIENAKIDFIRRVRPTRPQPAPEQDDMPLAIAESAAADILRDIARDIGAFRQGDPARRIQPGDRAAFQANPSSMLCAAKWCPAFGTEFCPEGAASKGGNNG